MGFEEVFAFLVVGGVTIYHQRSLKMPQNLTSDRLRLKLLWTLAVAIPCIAIAWLAIYKFNLPLTFVTTSFLILLWIYGNWQISPQRDDQVDDHLMHQLPLLLNSTEEQQLRDCFPQNIYQLKAIECYPHEISCRGRLRSQNYKYAYETISHNVHKIFGDRFVCALQESPIENLGTGFGKIANLQNDQADHSNYCFYLIPNNLDASSTPTKPLLEIVCSIVTVFTVIATGANIQSFADLSLSKLSQGIPYFLGIASIFITRAITQNYIAQKYVLKHSLSISWKINKLHPIFLPCLSGFGLLGSLSPNLNFLTPHHLSTGSPSFPQRRILFDLIAWQAIAGLTISVLLIILGNWFLIPAPTSAIADPQTSYTGLMLNLQSFDLKISILFALVHHTGQAIANFGKSLANPSEIMHSLSPLTLAGWAGLALSAVQLLPFSFLDGGYLAISMYGYRQALQISRIARIAILAIAILAQPWLRIYSLLLFLLPTPQPLIFNEAIELDPKRDLIGIALMAIALLIIMPLPKSLF